MIAEGYGTDNKEFMFDDSMFDIRTTNGIYELRGYKENKLIFYAKNSKAFKHCNAWWLIDSPNEMIEIGGWGSGESAKASDVKECFFILLTYILYFANNYSNLENSEINFK